MRQIFNFLSDKNVITLILFSSIPANMAMIGFLEYFNPVYLDRMGISQSNIGRTFIIYGFFQIYIGPFISKYIDASENKKTYIIVGGIFGSMAFISFYIFEGLLAVIVAILLLGFSQSFVFVSQATYLLKLKVTKEIGEGKGVAIFRSANRIGQTIGPILFGWLIVAMDINRGVAFLGLFYLFITVLLFFLIRTDKKIAVT
ncbi:MAG: MFS transporter [Desulfobacteraceae bacterium]|nr:MFS transporter [Desulfobacteraceae bacterium]